MNHILLRSLIPFTCSAILYLRRGFRASTRMLVITPVAMAIVSLWAVVPDIPRVLGRYELYHQMAADPRCNVFLFHYSIDLVETCSPLYHAGLVTLAASLILVAWRELRLREARQQ